MKFFHMIFRKFFKLLYSCCLNKLEQIFIGKSRHIEMMSENW